MNLQLELFCCTDVLLNEIAHKECKRDDVAAIYALAILSSEKTDWKAVNAAIMKRWSVSSLNYIKTLAWKMIERKPKK